MLLPKTIDKMVRNDTFDNPTSLDIASSKISEAILDGLLANKSKFNDFTNSYEMKINKNLDDSNSLLIKPKLSNTFSKVIQDVKATQTNIDMKVNRDERNISNISNILNAILRLKNIKKPLSKLPNGSEIAKKMKVDTKHKIYEQ